MQIKGTAAAAAAKSLQSCPTLCNPIDGSPPGSPIPGILQARILEWVAISFSNVWKWKVKVKSLSRVQLLATPWTAAYQAQATDKSRVPDFVSWETPEPNSFSKIWDKVVIDGFLLFPELHITFWFYQEFCLLEDCVKLLFCVTTSFNMTRIHFSTKRPLLVKILQRNLIGKTYNIL